MRTVVWSRRALEQLKAATAYLAEQNVEAAAVQTLRIQKTAAALGVRPIGRPGERPCTFVKRVTGTRYLIVYRPLGSEGGTLEILRLWHAAQNWIAAERP